MKWTRGMMHLSAMKKRSALPPPKIIGTNTRVTNAAGDRSKEGKVGKRTVTKTVDDSRHLQT